MSVAIPEATVPNKGMAIPIATKQKISLLIPIATKSNMSVAKQGAIAPSKSMAIRIRNQIEFQLGNTHSNQSSKSSMIKIITPLKVSRVF